MNLLFRMKNMFVSFLIFFDWWRILFFFRLGNYFIDWKASCSTTRRDQNSDWTSAINSTRWTYDFTFAFFFRCLSKLDFSASETIDADFTDSVSLILHQLQQEQEQQQQQPSHTRLSSSIAISEEDTDGDETDAESIVESLVDQTHRSSTSSVFVPMELSKSIQTDLSFNSKDNISFTKVQPKKIITPIQPATKKRIENPVSVRQTTPTTNPIKRPVVNKKSTPILPIKKTQLNAAQSVTSLQSQSSIKPYNKKNETFLVFLF